MSEGKAHKIGTEIGTEIRTEIGTEIRTEIGTEIVTEIGTEIRTEIGTKRKRHKKKKMGGKGSSILMEKGEIRSPRN